MLHSSLNTTTVVVVGLGKIGLPLAVQCAQAGCRVFGCDSDARVVDSVNSGMAYIGDEPELAQALPRLVKNGQFSATSDTSSIVRYADVVLIIVPLLLTAEHKPDFTSLDAATHDLGQGLQPGTLVIYETTLPVGTTRCRLASILEECSGLCAGRDFYLAYSPERVSSGSVFHDLRRYPKVVGGLDNHSTAAAETFYRSILPTPVITMASIDEAEFVKLIETTYRDVNIALANEYAQYADSHGLNVMAAISAANSQPYAHIHTPGIGVGGHCIPVYPYFLFANPLEESIPQPLQFANPLEEPIPQPFQLPQEARRINDGMAAYAVSRLERTLGSLRSVGVLLLGVTYRGNVRETAFSSALLLRTALQQQGARVYAHDPLYTDEELRSMGYEPLSPQVEHEIEAIVLQAAHSLYRSFEFVRFERCRVFFDGRQALDSERGRLQALGIEYLAPGDGAGMFVAEPREQFVGDTVL
jgi:nucleotide sugar dehydrogenase